MFMVQIALWMPLVTVTFCTPERVKPVESFGPMLVKERSDIDQLYEPVPPEA